MRYHAAFGDYYSDRSRAPRRPSYIVTPTRRAYGPHGEPLYSFSVDHVSSDGATIHRIGTFEDHESADAAIGQHKATRAK